MIQATIAHNRTLVPEIAETTLAKGATQSVILSACCYARRCRLPSGASDGADLIWPIALAVMSARVPTACRRSTTS